MEHFIQYFPLDEIDKDLLQSARQQYVSASNNYHGISRLVLEKMTLQFIRNGMVLDNKSIKLDPKSMTIIVEDQSTESEEIDKTIDHLNDR